MKLEINGIYKYYAKNAVLNDLKISLDNVSSLGIIGPSGCGKSTLLRLLSGIENPEYGEIFINGISPITDKKEFQNKIGVVFQQHNLFPHLTIERNITLILEKIRKVDKKVAQVKAVQLLDELFMLEHKSKLPSQLSGGQAQRASIARALATNPELIFLDEPTAALDPQLTYEVLQSVEKLKDKGINFIFVTHEMEFLQNFADHVLFLEQGKILEFGEISHLLQPSTQELRQFLDPHNK